ncbi:hypothetical protein HYH03_018416 [Edaphochlamys debaryana]|uniref:Uncharacterized protein n=1 Tax=Edaphochlamys debaryana TaxID=47281 RepID=A0A836BMZ2_9CHLO|nr:hypothetical protein HYH03_018416 [Edaphochlamys debaryana]|eukprot:KAG2482681.1 hypothetical protein HYH03_018416 [Edaphochlamys debaryana]
MLWRQYGLWCMGLRHEYFTNKTISDPKHWVDLAPGSLDNYMLRNVLGEAVYHLPAGKLTEQHLHTARKMVADSVDVIVILEDSKLLARTLKWALGWCDVEMQACNPNLSHHNTGLPLDVPLFWPKHLESINRLDVQFFRYCAFLTQLDAIMYDVVEANVFDRCADWVRPEFNATVGCV